LLCFSQKHFSKSWWLFLFFFVELRFYRVSTKKQLHIGSDCKEDIPMQRTACREFAARMGWSIGKEFEEKGISGSKVSADKRDAIQVMKDAAMKGEFQV